MVSTAAASTPRLMSVDELADHYGRAKKTIQNKITRGWGPVPVLDPDTGQVLGFRPEEVDRFDRRNQRTRAQYLYQ